MYGLADFDSLGSLLGLVHVEIFAPVIWTAMPLWLVVKAYSEGLHLQLVTTSTTQWWTMQTVYWYMYQTSTRAYMFMQLVTLLVFIYEQSCLGKTEAKSKKVENKASLVGEGITNSTVVIFPVPMQQLLRHQGLQRSEKRLTKR